MKRKSWLSQRLQSEHTRHVVAGAGAGCVSAAVTCPLDVLKTRMQSQVKPKHGVLLHQPAPYRGIYASFCRIWVEEGVRGFFRGMGPTLLGYLPTWSVYFSAYNLGKKLISTNLEKPPDSWLVHLLAAMSAGATTNVVTNPIWVVKTRLMTQSAYTPYYYRGTINAFQKIWFEEGIKGYYRGLGSSLLGVAHVAIQFPLYEHLRKKFSISICFFWEGGGGNSLI